MTPGVIPQLIIGLDAMEWSLVKRWAMEGRLPALRGLMDQGLQAELSSSAAQFPGTVWTAVHTGTNPAKFGKYFHVQYEPGTGNLKHVPDDQTGGVPFWKYLSQAGLQVGIADVPKTGLIADINGFQVINWGAHGSTTAPASQPPSLLPEIRKRFGDHPVADCDAAGDKPDAQYRLRRAILDGVHLHGELFRWLMRGERWDVFICSFPAAHCAGHRFWKYYQAGNATGSEALAGSLESVYRAVDREVAELMAVAGPGARCMAVAGHGMGPLQHASWNLPDILDSLGCGKRPPALSSGQRRGAVNPWRLLDTMLPGRMRSAMKNRLPRRLQDELLFRCYAARRDWRGWRAFAVPNDDCTGAIRINVRGRDKNGIVEPGAEYESVCREIARELEVLTDPLSGRRVVSRVTIIGKEFAGPYLDKLPDITVLWDSSFPWNTIHSPRFGTLHVPKQDRRSGSHTPHGFVLAKGPGIPAGCDLTGKSIYDIAPTVLQWAGVAIPGDLDGAPIVHLPASTQAARRASAVR
jgi:predicted AlkP superfamily phosphohydrolase/phosphomutase